MKEQPVRSPCIQVCAIDGQSGWCLGCGRSLKEIAQWTKYTVQQRDDVMESLPSRLSDLKAAGKLG
ncbi:MAG: DUF1289 domain-containing protein [Ponticaulis sp.]|nr:DUF1289 domain-containing protein [Ponticaulis sp.]